MLTTMFADAHDFFKCACLHIYRAIIIIIIIIEQLATCRTTLIEQSFNSQCDVMYDLMAFSHNTRIHNVAIYMI